MHVADDYGSSLPSVSQQVIHDTVCQEDISDIQPQSMPALVRYRCQRGFDWGPILDSLDHGALEYQPPPLIGQQIF